MRKKQSSFEQSKYKSRTKRVKYMHSADSIYARAWVSNVVVFMFVAIDFLCLKTVWNLVQTENPVFVYSLALACAMALDIPLALAAIAIKEFHEKLKSRNEMLLVVILSVLVFSLAFALSLGFRITTRELSFDIDGGETLVNTMEVATTETTNSENENIAVIFASVFSGVVPLLTSMSSFVISYFSCSPRESKILKMEKERIGLQANILDARKALAEVESVEEHYEVMIKREEELYQEYIRQLEAEEHSLKQLVRVLIMEKLKEPDGISAMTESAETLYKINCV